MDKMQQEPRIQAHRSTDVTDDDDRTGLALDLTPRQLDQLPSMLQVAPHNTPHIRIGASARWFFTTSRSHAKVPAHLSHQLLGLLHLVPGERFKILLPQQLNCTIGGS